MHLDALASTHGLVPKTAQKKMVAFGWMVPRGVTLDLDTVMMIHIYICIETMEIGERGTTGAIVALPSNFLEVTMAEPQILHHASVNAMQTASASQVLSAFSAATTNQFQAAKVTVMEALGTTATILHQRTKHEEFVTSQKLKKLLIQPMLLNLHKVRAGTLRAAVMVMLFRRVVRLT